MNNKKDYLQKRYPNASFPAPFAQFFNIHFTKLEEGRAHAEVIVDKSWTNPFGIAHGGFLFTILDEALGTSACLAGEVTSFAAKGDYESAKKAA